tara:strand:+ start:2621 stop:3088 length:468 start_codon:yes stop_codon:yes gene_type:complete
MLHEKAVKKVEKALGGRVESFGGGRFGMSYDGWCISWRTSPSDYLDETSPLRASSWHIRLEDDYSDIMTDYFAGHYVDNVTQLIRSVKKPEPKFPLGSLVRGKNNKRATRQGYAGRMAIVTEAGDYMKLKWIDTPQTSYYTTYPERDFEVISEAG